MNLAFPAAAASSIDTALFLGTRRSLFRTSPGRAFGSLAFLAVSTTLAARSMYEGGGKPAPYTVGLAAAALAGNVAMLGIHLRHRVAGPRVFLGVAFAGIALGDTLRRR